MGKRDVETEWLGLRCQVDDNLGTGNATRIGQCYVPTAEPRMGEYELREVVDGTHCGDRVGVIRRHHPAYQAVMVARGEAGFQWKDVSVTAITPLLSAPVSIVMASSLDSSDHSSKDALQ